VRLSQDLNDAFWAELAARPWRRVKWRRGREPAGQSRCAVFDTPIHRVGTYYLRPAYTDGEIWISQRAYEEMVRRTSDVPPSRSYGRRDDLSLED
jgi:hypothetical protein